MKSPTTSETVACLPGGAGHPAPGCPGRRTRQGAAGTRGSGVAPVWTKCPASRRCAAIRSIFSICNALCQGGLLTLPDVPPSVCYPSRRHRQRRGPKPGGQRNLDPRIGRERASRHGDCQHHGGRGPAVRIRSTQVKCRLRAVITNKPKMLSGLNQKVCGQVQGLRLPLARMSHHRPIGTTLPRSDREDERSNPVVSPQGKADRKEG